MNNNPLELNDILFEELRRLMDINLNDDAFVKETERAKFVTAVSMAAIANRNTTLKANEFVDGSFCKIRLPEFLGASDDGEPKKISRPRLLDLKKDA
jgi:hypothetical protein